MSAQARARPTRPAARSEQLRHLLRDAGLEGRVRVGLTTPERATPSRALPTARLPGSAPPPVPPGTEEAFSPDALLRPLVPPAQGQLIELTGPPSSGRTALAARLAAGVTLRGELVGWVDGPGALDPRALARCGAQLRSVLWVRPPRLQAALRSAELLLRAGLALVVLDLERPLPEADPRAGGELDRLGASVWTRLARAARGARATLLVIASRHRAGTQATLVLQTGRARARFESGLLEGLDATLRVLRARETPLPRSLSFRLHHRT